MTALIRSNLSGGSFGFGFCGKPDSNVLRGVQAQKNPRTAIAVERAYVPVCATKLTATVRFI